nr:hypothetical protein [Tanacetum cinerariifolium]
EMHPEDDDEEDPEEDPVDYPADGGDDGDNKEESSEDEEDDEMDVRADEEEEEHPAPADSIVVAPTAADQAQSAEETEPFETDESAATPPPHPAYRTTARISIPAPVPMPTWTDLEVVRLLAISSPPTSPLSSWEDRPEVTLPPRKRLDIALGPRYETERQLLAGRLNMLFRDRRAHAYTHQLMEIEAKMSREAWISEIRELQAADRRRQTVISELLRMDHRRSTETSESRTALQGQITALQGQKQMAPRRTTRSIADQETVNATTVTNAQLQIMIDQGVTTALATRDALRSTNGDDSHNSGTGVRRTERAARECTYTDFLKCQPLPFKGTEGVPSLSQWCERMKSIFYISNCTTENQVKFATCTLHSVALTWWNTHV